MLGIDLKKDVIDFCAMKASELGYDGLKFITDDITNTPKDIKFHLTCRDWRPRQSVLKGHDPNHTASAERINWWTGHPSSAAKNKKIAKVHILNAFIACQIA